MANKEDLAYDDEWSRLIHAIGKDALVKMQQSKVLLSGLKGLGLEVAKNIVLMGAKSVTIHDSGVVQLPDLSSQFYLSEQQLGQNRATASLVKLSELNPRVDISVHTGELTDELIKTFTVVLLTNARSDTELLHVSELCHANDIKFIAADAFGLLGWVFVDFGAKHLITDPDGEPAKTGFIWTISEEEKAIVTCLEGKRHDLADGDVVTFHGVKGMDGINGKQFAVTAQDPYAFTIGDTRGLGTYAGGGEWTQVKLPTPMAFDSLKSFWTKQVDFERVSLMDFSKFERPAQHWITLQALYRFQGAHQRLPKPWDAADAAEIVALAGQVNDALENKADQVDTKLVTRLAQQSAGDLSPVAAFLGGIIAQEIIKASSGKFTPLRQFFMWDSLECLPEADITDAAPTGTRYDGQVAVFGQAIQQRVLDARYFLVGAGAIGCEMLKNFAMIGLGCGKGSITVTDMDNIEISNLNRQFLYRNNDVKKMKSETAAAAVKHMNPQMNITAYVVKVAPETEDVYNNDFWDGLTGVCNALDSVPARMYVDSRCVFFRKSLLESGTLGPKGNVQVVVPFITESYGSSADPPEKSSPVCLVHSFPYNIDHCLQWAREVQFEGAFVNDPDIVCKWLDKDGYLDTVAPNLKRNTTEILHKTLVQTERSFDECIGWARLRFEKIFNEDIRQLLHQFPADFKDNKTGAPFWSGTKRPPVPTVFDPSNELHVTFVVAATFLRAWTLGLIASELKDEATYKQQVAHITAVAAATKVPEWKPAGSLKIATEESDDTPAGPTAGEDDDDVIARLLPQLPARSAAKRPNIVDFEKDDDRNFHIDFIHAASNIRALQYNIVAVDRLQSKLKAGRIVPAIVTTTASVTGLVCLELYKLLQERTKIEDYRNSFMNLALPLFSMSEPIAPKKEKWGRDRQFSLWDTIAIRKGDLSLKELLETLSKEHGIEVDVLSVGSALIYSSWMPPAKQAERLPRNITGLVAEVSKTDLKPGQRHVSVVATGTVDDEDVELPPIVVWL